jgi:hypothetical protein
VLRTGYMMFGLMAALLVVSGVRRRSPERTAGWSSFPHQLATAIRSDSPRVQTGRCGSLNRRATKHPQVDHCFQPTEDQLDRWVAGFPMEPM